MLQLNTWNDYEEGSAIETGIENCFSLSTSVSGSKVNWSIIGPEQTIHTYRVFISDDGEKLMKLKDVTPGTRSLDLASYGFAAGTYKVYVKAIGKPSIVNRMSNAATFTVSGTTPPPTAPPDEPPTEPENPPAEDLTVSVLPSIVKVMQGENAMASVNIAGATDLNLSCKGLPAYASCSFGPVSGTASLATTTLTIRTSETVRVSQQRSSTLLVLAFFGLSGVVVIAIDRRRVAWALCIVLLSGTMIGCTVFGKQETQSASHPELKVAPKGEFSLEVNAVKGTTQASTKMTVVVQ